MFWRKRSAKDFSAEIEAHLQQEYERLREDGVSEQEARAAARRAFGNVTHAQEKFYESRHWMWWDHLKQDIHFGLRMLRKSPGFTLLLVLTLGLGIGVNAIIFNFVNALLFRPPAVQDASRLLEVWQRNPKTPGLEEYTALTYPDYAYYRDHNQVFEGLMAFDGEMHPVSWSRSGVGQMVQGQLVSWNFFSVLGVRPALGRFFSPDEDQRRPGDRPVVVLSGSLWRKEFAEDPNVLGKILVLNGTDFTVIGVAPKDFTGIVVGNEPDFWTPLMMTPTLIRDNAFLTSNGSFWLFGVGRLKPGIRPAQVQANLRMLSSIIRQDHPENHKDLEAATFAVRLIPEPFRGYVSAFTGLLMAVVGLVLLIACANATNLLLAQATGRRREMAIRTALGASRNRLLCQMLLESSIVATLGGGVAVVLTMWITPALLALKPPSLPIRIDVHLDWRVVTFTLAASIATGIAFGIAPAFRSARIDAPRALKEESSIGGFRGSRLRSTLVVAQIAVCLVLLIGANLCLRSLLHAQSLDPGFDTHHVALAVLDPGALGYSETRGKIYYQQLLERVEALPGVTSASLASHLPLTTANWSQDVSIDGYASSQLAIPMMTVARKFFATMGIPLERGREFTSRDVQAVPGAVIINEVMAARFWPGQDPIGQQFSVIDKRVQVIGVAKTGKYRTLGEDAQPFMYLPIGYRARATLVVRTAGNPQVLLSALRHEMQALDPNVVPFDMESIQEYMALPMFPAHTTALLLGAFGLLALILAVAGLYGVMSYSVSQRTHEMGVRMALGAGSRDVLKLVVGHGLNLTLIGVPCGLLGAFALTRFLAGLLYGVRPTDPATFIAVPLFLALVTIVASYIPAHRAAKVDPQSALRHE